ncbi:MAG: ABC transporter substrate-binding protein [Acidimicrobiia bacterium]
MNSTPFTSHSGARRARRGLAAVLAATMALSAAVIAGGSAGAASKRGSGAVDKAGVLRIPVDLTALGGVKFDPTTVGSPDNWYSQGFLYDSLLRQNADGSYSPGLAKSATIVDPQTIEVELQPDLTFTDGTPLDAEAVKFSIERNMATDNVASFRVELQEVETITVDSPTTLTIALRTPTAGQFYNLLAHGETFVVSPTAAQSGTSLDDEPVGAGPFTLESFTPEREVVFVKNPDYFQAKKIKLAGVTLVQVTTTDAQATVNALLDDVVDASSLTSLDQVSPLEGAGFEVVSLASDSSQVYGSLCKSKPPFDSVEVRQALNFATDREELNELIYQGTSEPVWASWTQGSELFNPKLKNIYAYNVNKAKKLLKRAGAEDLTFDFYTGPLPEQQRAAEVLKEQWAKAGITANLVNLADVVQEFFVEVKADAGLVPFGRAGLDKVTRSLQAGSVGNLCNYEDPELNALVDDVRRLEGTDEVRQAWWDLDEYVFENALSLFLVWTPRINAYNPDVVANVVFRPDVFGAPRLDVFKAYIKK